MAIFLNHWIFTSIFSLQKEGEFSISCNLVDRTLSYQKKKQSESLQIWLTILHIFSKFLFRLSQNRFCVDTVFLPPIEIFFAYSPKKKFNLNNPWKPTFIIYRASVIFTRFQFSFLLDLQKTIRFEWISCEMIRLVSM
jgi:hypothetical protein